MGFPRDVVADRVSVGARPLRDAVWARTGDVPVPAVPGQFSGRGARPSKCRRRTDRIDGPEPSPVDQPAACAFLARRDLITSMAIGISDTATTISRASSMLSAINGTLPRK